MEMPAGTAYGIPATQTWFGGNLTDYVKTGRTSQARLTVSFSSFIFWGRPANVLRKDMATRIIAAWYLTGQEKGFPAVNFDTRTVDSGPLNLHVDVQGDHYKYVHLLGSHFSGE